MKIKNVSIEKVIPYARNPRRNQGAIAKVAASIKEFGWQQPIVVDTEMVVIAGHTRLAAAQSLGMSEVPIVVAENLTPAQVKAYRLADNRVSQEAEWDEDLLTLELQDLVGEEYDLDLTGFSDDELKNLVSEVEALDAFPALPDGEREPFQQMTFTLHDEQVEYVKAAIDVARKMGHFTDSLNENSNGNALSRVCEMFLVQHGNG